MMMPSIFRENLFDSLMGELGFPEIDRALYGKNAKNLMKTDVQDFYSILTTKTVYIVCWEKI